MFCQPVILTDVSWKIDIRSWWSASRFGQSAFAGNSDENASKNKLKAAVFIDLTLAFAVNASFMNQLIDIFQINDKILVRREKNVTLFAVFSANRNSIQKFTIFSMEMDLAIKYLVNIQFTIDPKCVSFRQSFTGCIFAGNNFILLYDYFSFPRMDFHNSNQLLCISYNNNILWHKVLYSFNSDNTRRSTLFYICIVANNFLANIHSTRKAEST